MRVLYYSKGMKSISEKIAEAQERHLKHLQFLGTVVVRDLIKHGTLDIEKIKYDAIDLGLIEETENGEIKALPNKITE